MHGKIYNKTFVTRKDSDQPVHPPNMARVLVYPSLDSLKAVKSTVKILIRLRGQFDLSLRWSHKSYCRFCRAHISVNTFNLSVAKIIFASNFCKYCKQNMNMLYVYK